MWVLRGWIFPVSELLYRSYFTLKISIQCSKMNIARGLNRPSEPENILKLENDPTEDVLKKEFLCTWGK